MNNKEKFVNEFNRILKYHQHYYNESKDYNIPNFVFSSKCSIINDFTSACDDDDYKLMNKILCGMISEVQLYELFKSKQNDGGFKNEI